VSRQRRTARAERERVAAAQLAARDGERARLAAARARRERRSQWWRRLRLWQRTPSSARRRERWGVLGALVLVLLVAVFVATRSVTLVVVTALVLLVAAPVLVVLGVGRDRR
jgi:Flp pilus assembly protein TadB